MKAAESQQGISRFGSWDVAIFSLLRAARSSRFVADPIARSSATPVELQSDPASWDRLAPTSKEDVLADQRARPPYGSRPCLPVKSIGLIVESSGSSGSDKEIHYVGRQDMARIRRSWAEQMRRLGISASDVVAFTFPIGMSGGGIKHSRAYEELGAKLLRIAHLSTEDKLSVMAYFRASVLVATPAYLDRLAFAARETGKALHDLGLRKVLTATQSVTVEWVRGIQESAGVKLYEWYGTSSGLAAFTCSEGMVNSRAGRGTLHWGPASALIEVADPVTGACVADGEKGDVIGTPLFSQAEGLFRFRTGDEVTFVAPGACLCGSSEPGIQNGTVRRLDDMFKIKGSNVWPSKCESVIFGFDEVEDYRVRIRLDDDRRERVKLEVRTSVAPPDLAVRIEDSLRRRTGLKFEVVVRASGADWEQSTSGEAGKVKRWIDERSGASLQPPPRQTDRENERAPTRRAQPRIGHRAGTPRSAPTSATL